MLGPDLAAATIDDVRALVAAGTLESLRLDLKERVDLASDEGKAELVEDVAAFANAAGGDIVIGVPEAKDAQGKRTGGFGEPVGVAVANRDAFMLAVENAVRDRVEPRIVGLQYAFLPTRDGKYVVVVRIPRSYGFHFVKRKGGWMKAVARNGVGKYTLDVGQVRDDLLGAEAVPQRMAAFRQERLARILADEAGRPMEQVAKVVVHLLPVQAFAGGGGPQVSFTSYGGPVLKGPHTSLMERVHNLDGLLAWTGYGERAIAALQVFRSGAFEGVETGLGGPLKDGFLQLNPHLDGYLVNGIHRYLEAARAYGVAPPLYVAVSLVGAKGYSIWTERRGVAPTTIDRDVVALPEVEIPRLDYDHQELARLLRPVFDVMFQASGHARSWNYRPDGGYAHELGGDYVRD